MSKTTVSIPQNVVLHVGIETPDGGMAVRGLYDYKANTVYGFHSDTPAAHLCGFADLSLSNGIQSAQLICDMIRIFADRMEESTPTITSLPVPCKVSEVRI